MFVKAFNMFYPVTMELLGKQLAITKTVSWYRNGTSSLNGFSGVQMRCPTNELKTLKKVEIKAPRVSKPWHNEIVKDLKALSSSSVVVYKCDDKTLRDCAIILLGSLFFDTQVPVYKLNVFDKYFAFSPSRAKLWKEGYKTYNPYTYEGEKIDTEYTLSMYYEDVKNGNI